jgi:hypothetical protein
MKNDAKIIDLVIRLFFLGLLLFAGFTLPASLPNHDPLGE